MNVWKNKITIPCGELKHLLGAFIAAQEIWRIRGNILNTIRPFANQMGFLPVEINIHRFETFGECVGRKDFLFMWPAVPLVMQRWRTKTSIFDVGNVR